MGKHLKIYFVEKTIPFNSLDIDKPFIGGSEKTLINISNELANDKSLIIKVFNLTSKKNIIKNVEWNNINNVSSNDQPDILISMSDANLLSLFRSKRSIYGRIVFNQLKNLLGKSNSINLLKINQ